MEVTATDHYDGAGRAQPVALSEQELRIGIELSASFRLFFDRFLLPHKVIRQSVCLHPTTATVDSIDDCASPYQPFTEPEYNPVLRQVVYRLPAGDRLKADTLYRLTVFVPPSADDSGLFAFDGAPLARRYAYNFRTKSDESSAKDEPLPSRDRYCAAQHCFSGCAGDADPQACKDDCQRLCLNEQCGSLGDGNLLGGPPGGSLFATCALGGCHGPQTNDDGLAMGLDLSTVSALSSSAIGKTAHQTQTGEAATIGQVSGKRFGRAMAVIEPYNPGGSYLMYKLLVASRNHADDIDPSLEAEIARLRAGVVVGLPMPPPTYGATTSAEPGQLQKRMQLISDWIAHGATTDCGPASEP